MTEQELDLLEQFIDLKIERQMAWRFTGERKEWQIADDIDHIREQLKVETKERITYEIRNRTKS